MVYNRQYITDDFTITTEYVQKYNARYPSLFPLNTSNKKIERYVQREINTVIAPMIEMIFGNHDPKLRSMLSKEHFLQMLLNLADYTLKYLLGEISNPLLLKKIYNNEIRAFWINNLALVTPLIDISEVENKTDPEKFLLDLKTNRNRIKFDKDLLNKIDSGKKNPYLRYLKQSIKVLNVQKEHQNIKNKSEPILVSNIGLNKDLKSLFIYPGKYYENIEKLCVAKKVIKSNGNLKFKGYKYEVIELFMAMEDLGLIKKTNEAQKVVIAANTFNGFSLSERQARSSSIGKHFEYYKEILS